MLHAKGGKENFLKRIALSEKVIKGLSKLDPIETFRNCSLDLLLSLCIFALVELHPISFPLVLWLCVADHFLFQFSEGPADGE